MPATCPRAGKTPPPQPPDPPGRRRPTPPRGRATGEPQVSEQQALTEDAYAEPELPADKDGLPDDPAEVLGETVVVVDRATGELLPAAQPPPRTEAPLDLLHPTRKEIEWIAQAFIASGYIKDAQSFGQAVTKIVAGLEIGVAPFQAMRGMDIIGGEPQLSAGLVGALVKRSGKYDYRVRTSNEEECVLDWYQDGELVGESMFSMADAQRAKLVKGAWLTYPRSMLFSRALTAGARMHCPDVFGGAVYGAGELNG